MNHSYQQVLVKPHNNYNWKPHEKNQKTRTTHTFCPTRSFSKRKQRWKAETESAFQRFFVWKMTSWGKSYEPFLSTGFCSFCNCTKVRTGYYYVHLGPVFWFLNQKHKNQWCFFKKQLSLILPKMAPGEKKAQVLVFNRHKALVFNRHGPVRGGF